MANNGLICGPIFPNRFPPDSSLGQIVHKKLKSQPANKIILIDDEEEITVQVFLSATECLATYLKSCGIAKNDIVSIVASNNWKHLAVVIACMYIGATANPLNDNYSIDELTHFFDLTDPKVIFCTRKSLANVQKGIKNNAKVIVTDSDAENVVSLNDLLDGANTCSNYELAQVDPDNDIAIIMSSSGTTGLPKAVMLSNTSFKVQLENAGLKSYFHFNENLRTVIFLPIFHAYGLWLSLSAIVYDCYVVIMGKFQADKFLQIIEKHKINTVYGVPSTLSFLIRHPDVEKYNLESLEEIISGGSFLLQEVEDMFKAKYPSVAVHHVWGMTELGLIALFTGKNGKSNKSLGKVVPNFQMAISELECSEDTPNYLGPNKYGELCVRSVGLTKGYLHNKIATKLLFDMNGFLKTGDLGYYNEDGEFFMIGRLKEIIKCKGFQVPPTELEALIIKHPGVEDVAIVGKADDKCGEVPVAFVVKAESSNVCENEIIQFVKDNISIEKHLYGGVVFVSEIPKTPSGKILRRKLVEAFNL